MKLSINRLLDISKLATTEAGKQLRELLEYTSSMAEQVLRALRNQLTFEDNFLAEIRTVTLAHDTEQVVEFATRQPTGMLVRRVVDTTSVLDGFNWYINEDGNAIVKALFSPTPSGTIPVEIIVFF